MGHSPMIPVQILRARGLLAKTTRSVPRIILEASRGRNEAISCGMRRTGPEKLYGCFAKVRDLEQAADCRDERRSGGDIWRLGARASFQFHELLAPSLCLPSVLCTSFLGIIPLGLEAGFSPLLSRDVSSFLLPV